MRVDSFRTRPAETTDVYHAEPSGSKATWCGPLGRLSMPWSAMRTRRTMRSVSASMRSTVFSPWRQAKTRWVASEKPGRPSGPRAPASIHARTAVRSSGVRRRRLGKGVGALSGRSSVRRRRRLPAASNGTTNPLGPAISTRS